MNANLYETGVMKMADVIAVLERARSLELEIKTQIEHIEQLHRISKRAVE